MAPPTAIKMSSAAAAKTFSLRENLGGSGGGSFSPRTRMFSEVRAAPVSVTLIVRPGLRCVVLAVFVLVRLGSVSGDVQARRRGRFRARPHGHRNLYRLSRLLVPDPQALRSHRDSVEAKRAVRAGDCGEIGVDDHHEPDHLGVDVAVDPDKTRLFELLLLRRSGPVEAEVETIAPGDRENVVVDRIDI